MGPLAGGHESGREGVTVDRAGDLDGTPRAEEILRAREFEVVANAPSFSIEAVNEASSGRAPLVAAVILEVLSFLLLCVRRGDGPPVRAEANP